MFIYLRDPAPRYEAIFNLAVGQGCPCICALVVTNPMSFLRLRKTQYRAESKAEHGLSVLLHLNASRDWFARVGACPPEGRFGVCGRGTSCSHSCQGRGVVYFATLPITERAALKLGLSVQPFFGAPNHLNLALDGADQVGPTGWLVKGAGRAHTREKVVGAAAERFVVLVSSEKLATKLTPPIPLELLAFGAEAALRSLGGLPDSEGTNKSRRRSDRRLPRPVR